MSSGVGVSDECIEKFQELKLGHKHQYIIFKLNDDNTEVIVEKTAEPGTSYDDFQGSLPPTDCRYAVYDFEYEVDGGKRNKLVFAVWAPDSSKIKSKMLYASSKDNFRKKLVGIGTEIQATDASEIAHEEVLEKILR